jgi:hypothetical protein
MKYYSHELLTSKGEGEFFFSPQCWHFISLCKEYNYGYEEFVSFAAQVQSLTACEVFVDNFRNIYQKVYTG